MPCNALPEHIQAGARALAATADPVLRRRQQATGPCSSLSRSPLRTLRTLQDFCRRGLAFGRCIGRKNIGKRCVGKLYARSDDGGQSRAFRPSFLVSVGFTRIVMLGPAPAAWIDCGRRTCSAKGLISGKRLFEPVSKNNVVAFGSLCGIHHYAELGIQRHGRVILIEYGPMADGGVVPDAGDMGIAGASQFLA